MLIIFFLICEIQTFKYRFYYNNRNYKSEFNYIKIMIGNLKKLEKELSQCNVVRVKVEKISPNSLEYSYPTIFKAHSVAFSEFIVHFNRVILIYSGILDSKKNNQKFKYYSFTQIAIILIITSLEIYFTKLYRHLSKLISIENITYDNFLNFLQKFNIRINKTEENYKALGKIKLFYLLPEKLRFQEKSYLKAAFKTFDIDLYNLTQNLWEKIFSQDITSYVKIRHRAVHGITDEIFLKYDIINIETVENCMLDIAKFIYLIDEHIVRKFTEVQHIHTFFQKPD